MKIRSSITKTSNGYTVVARTVDAADGGQSVYFRGVADLQWARHYKRVATCLLFDGLSGNGFDLIESELREDQIWADSFLRHYLRRAPKPVSINSSNVRRFTAAVRDGAKVELSDGRIVNVRNRAGVPSELVHRVKYAGGVAYYDGMEVLHVEVVNGYVVIICI